MSSSRIVKVFAGLKGCEILVDSLATAKVVRKRCFDEGVWESRSGVRYLVIHKMEIDKVKIVRVQQQTGEVKT